MPVTNIRGQQILNGTVQYVDIQQVAASRLVGNPTGSVATMSEISLGTGLSFSGSSVVLSTNLQSLSGLSYSAAAFVKMTAAGTFTLDTAVYGTVTSVALALGTSGTDVNISGSPITTSGTITLNIPDASATARGLMTITSQTFSGTKAFNNTVFLNDANNIANHLAIKSGTNGYSYSTTGYVSLTSSAADNLTVSFQGATKIANFLGSSLSAARTYTLPNASGTLALTSDISTNYQAPLNGTGFVKASGTTISYDNSTYYLASNPSGYTSNTGTVTSVGGTGTVSGLTLTGTVTTSGNLTLGGTLTLTSGNVTTALGYTPYNSTNPNGYITAAQTYYIGTTLNALNRSSAAQSLTGITSIDGYANNIRSGEISNLNTAWTNLGTSISNGLQIFRYQNTASNSPEVADNANWLMNIYSHPSGSTASYGHQISGVDSNNIYVRYVQDGSFGAWYKIWTAGTLNNLNQLTNGPGYIAASQTYYIGTTQNALNRSSAAQTLTGISIDGNAGTATYLKSPFPYNVNITDSTTAASLTEPGSLSSVNMHDSHGYFSGYATTLTISGYDRYGAYQISGAYNASVPDLAMRNYYQGTSAFTGWVRILSSSNYNTYAPTLTGGGASGNWGINVTGYSGKVLSTSVTNVNTQRTAGYLEYYDVESATGAPSTGWYSFISVRHGNPSNQYGFQFANGFDSDTLYWRGWDGTNPKAWRTIVHSGNIGSFETDTLATVMTRGSSSSTYMSLSGGGGFTGNEYTFTSNVGSGVYLGSSSTVRLQAYSNDGGAAFMTFHRSNSWAVNMGLDPDNVFRIGGFSASANRLQLNMSGDLTVAGSVNSTTNITVGTDIYLTQLTSPNTSTIRFGDNTGWTFRFQTSVSSTWTTRFSFTDGGTFTAVGDIIAYSDARVKTNVVTIKDSLEKVQQLRGVTYNRTDSTDDSEKIGVIAQEIQKVLPQVVTKDADGMLGVSYGNLAGVFIEAIKEQQIQIEDLKKQIQYLVENR